MENKYKIKKLNITHRDPMTVTCFSKKKKKFKSPSQLAYTQRKYVTNGKSHVGGKNGKQKEERSGKQEQIF